MGGTSGVSGVRKMCVPLELACDVLRRNSNATLSTLIHTRILCFLSLSVTSQLVNSVLISRAKIMAKTPRREKRGVLFWRASPL